MEIHVKKRKNFEPVPRFETGVFYFCGVIQC